VGLQAALPLFLAFAVVAHGHAGGIEAPHGSAIHPLHAGHAPGSPLPPAQHPGHQHAHCILCQGLQAAGPATLPSALALAAPPGDVAAPAATAPTALRVFGSPAAYISRAPPSIG
jgi:hypothetical protein